MTTAVSIVANEELPEQFQLRSLPKQKRTRDAFNRILDAAIDLINEQGMAATNTNIIAERAGLDVASLYRIFPNKESIYYWTADRWLSNIRQACEEMNHEKYQSMDWRSFFAEHGKRITALTEYQKACAPLMPLWGNYPEFQKMLELHYAYMTRFFVAHLQRLGASSSKAELEHLVNYLMISSDNIRGVAPSLTTARSNAFYRLDYETWMFHLSEILPEH